MIHKGTVLLETDRLILRQFIISDDKAMFRNWTNDSDVTKYLTWPTHQDISETRQILKCWIDSYKKPDCYQWAIELKGLGEAIGSISVVKQQENIKMVEIGYCIGKSWWHQGYTTEALNRLIRFFFEEVGVNRIEARHDPRNQNSGKVMQKAGMIYEGTLRESDINNQEGYCDAAYYAILSGDYQHK